MANLSNPSVMVAKGYATVKTQFGFRFSTYVECWKCRLSDVFMLKVFYSAPSGYTCNTTRTAANNDCKSTKSCLVYYVNEDCCDATVQHVCDNITMYVECKCPSRMAAFVWSRRFGAVYIKADDFVTYKDLLDYVNSYELDPAHSWDHISAYFVKYDQLKDAIKSLNVVDETTFETMYRVSPLVTKCLN